MRYGRSRDLPELARRVHNKPVGLLARPYVLERAQPVNRRLPLLLGALTLATFVGTADAGRFSGGVHFGGGARFSAGVHVGGSVHYATRPSYGGGYYSSYRYRPSYGWGVHGRIWVGGYYPYYYYPSYYYYSPYYVETVPSYYPVQPTAYAGPSTVAAYAPPPPLPKLGIGLFAGGVATDYNQQTNTSETDIGVLGRFRLTDGLLVEGELGKVSTSVKDPQTGATIDNVRVDRRLGGALVYEFNARNSFAPYVLGGLGVQQASVNGDYNTTQDYAEIGIGLRLALSRNFHLTFDVRAGQRTSVSSPSPMAATLPPNTTASMVAPPPSSGTSDNSEDYTRARLAAILYF